MQSETFKLEKTKAKADIKATYDKIAQELALNKESMQLVLAGYIKDLIISDATIKAASTKEMRKRYVESQVYIDGEGNSHLIPGYFARDAKAAEKITEKQVLAVDIMTTLDKLDELHTDPRKFLPSIFNQGTSEKIKQLSSDLEIALKKQFKMGANYQEYERYLVQSVIPTARLLEKFGIYKTKSNELRKIIIDKLKSEATVRGATGETVTPTIATQENIEKFAGKKGTTKISN
jgi:hypothetical protein